MDRRIMRGLSAASVVALVLGLSLWSAPSVSAAPGSVRVTVHSVGVDPDIYGFYDLSLRPPGGFSVAGFRGAVPGEQVTLTEFGNPDIPPGTYELSVAVGGPGTNPGTLATRTVVVPDGAGVDVGVTVDDRLACVEGTVRTADGSALPPFALQGTLPGSAAFPAFIPEPGGATYSFDESFFGCGIAGAFTVSALDLDTFEPLAQTGAVARPGETVTVDVVIGPLVEPTISVSGNPNARVLTTSDGRNLISVWAGSTQAITVSFPVTCPGGGAASAVTVNHGAATVAATNTPPGSASWSATFTRAQLVNGSVLATATCPGGVATHDLGSVLLYDPSGYVTDAVSGAPIAGATVSLYEVEGWRPRTGPDDTAAKTCESNDSKASGAPWAQLAATEDGVLATQAGLDGRTSPDVPVQTTDAAGHYAWDVAYGCWYVTVAKAGYVTATSFMVGVPPEVTDLDIELEPLPDGACDSTAFSDVDESSPFCADITWMVAQGITNGYTDGTFRPGVGVSRQAVAAWLYRYAGQPAPVGPCDTTGGFSDVPASHAFCHQIMWMVNDGLANGYVDGTFKPTNPISRQAMAAFLFRLAEQEETGPCAGTGFPDVPVGHAFCHEIAWMVANGITNGYSDGTFKPTNTISRQAGAAFLHRFDALPPT